MQTKAITELSIKEKIEYHVKIEKIKHAIFELESSIREGQDARHDLFKTRYDLSRIQEWYFIKEP